MPKAEAEIGWVIDLVTAIRSVRAEMNIDRADSRSCWPARRSKPRARASAGRIHQAAGARFGNFLRRTAPQGSVQLVVRGEVAALPLKGVIDLAAERARLAKEMQKADADIARVDAKLDNPNFIARAPEEVVDEEKEKREEADARKAKDRGGAGAAQGRDMIDPNNRPGGPNLVLTAKSANKMQFFDAATLAQTGEIDMPASTHEMIRSPDGDKIYASVYGGGIFGKNKDPDRRIAVIDLAVEKARTHHRCRRQYRAAFGDDGCARHAVVDRLNSATRCWRSIPPPIRSSASMLGGSPHWIAVSHATDKLFASFKTKEAVAVVDIDTRRRVGTIAIPHGAEGIAVSPDGETLFVCAHRKGVLHVFERHAPTIRRTIAIDGAPGEANQLRRVRVSPDGATSARPRMSTISPRSTRPTRSSRSAALTRRRRPWASASPPTACTPIFAAMTPRSRWSSSWRHGRVTRQFDDRGRL